MESWSGGGNGIYINRGRRKDYNDRLEGCATVNVVLISTYELGHQPFGLASPAAWLRARGAQVICLDLSRQPFQEQAIREAGLVAFYVPMHTATRLAAQLVERVRRINPRAHLCFYGLYAPVNEAYLRGAGVETILGGEFEAGLARLCTRLTEQENGEGANAGPGNAAPSAPVISLERLDFLVPDRSGLPPLAKYAHVLLPDGGSLVAGYTEASRGCKHLCRHCPIVPVYNGAFRVVQQDVVLEDIRRQVAAGAQHISFGDPDFFNGPSHALAIVEALHREFPRLSYDVTIKIEHLLRQGAHLERLRDTGCLFVTTAVESVDDAVLERLDKGHTRADFLAVVRHFRKLGMVLHPTFVPFTPWTTPAGYGELLAVLAEQELVENVAPIQLGIRLLIPAGSRLLELNEVRQGVGAFDPASLVYPWRHSDARMDRLAERVQDLAAAADKAGLARAETFARIWRAASEVQIEAQGAGHGDGLAGPPPASSLLGPPPALPVRAAIPHLSEAWYCCAEPTRDQFVSLAEASQSMPEPAALV
jgi:radical SAM superfamily enzyme YgiQ (UPF0313 family)